ncbi:hypothetical protein ACFOY4_01510 [Actinomadura syzygii]|uniref:Uncharacterized protein n=1 Tax=Actinomadura syzygii TaxID=1427538 RepID=A0A5D0TT98_9ACTN|nr:hypothetical protein [Actinomadura syzygii]TYC08576.1 hypothetical protein FXF65_37415 [Actinomadura syzygii]
MHRLLPLGIALAFVGSWLGWVPVSVEKFDCGSLYQPKILNTDFGPDFPVELLGKAQSAFDSVDQACASRRRMVAYPMGAIIVAGIGAAVIGGMAWRRGVAAPRATTP